MPLNVMLTAIGRRGYIANYFKSLAPRVGRVVGSTDRADESEGFSDGLLSCDEAYKLPSSHDERYIDSLLTICRERQIDLLTSLHDLDALNIARYLPKLRKTGVYPVISSFEVNTLCYDKLKCERFLSANGFVRPRTCTSLDEARAKLSLPIIGKPRFGFGSIGVVRIDSWQMAELISDSQPDMLFQEWISAPEYRLDIFNNAELEPVVCIVQKKIGMRAGETDQAVTVEHPDLLEFGIELASKLGNLGPLDVDVFDTRSGPMVIDINPRFGGGYPLSHAAGTNFPKLMCDLAEGRTIHSMLGNYQTELVMLKTIRPQFARASELALTQRI